MPPGRLSPSPCTHGSALTLPTDSGHCELSTLYLQQPKSAGNNVSLTPEAGIMQQSVEPAGQTGGTLQHWQAGFLWGGSCRCLSQHPQHFSLGGRCRPQRPWGSSSLPSYQKDRPVPCSASASFLWGGSSQCHSQHPQRSSRAGGAARSAPGVAAHYRNTKGIPCLPIAMHVQPHGLAHNTAYLCGPHGACR